MKQVQCWSQKDSAAVNLMATQASQNVEISIIKGIIHVSRRKYYSEDACRCRDKITDVEEITRVKTEGK